MHTQSDGLIKLLPFPEDNKSGLIVFSGCEVVCVLTYFLLTNDREVLSAGEQ
jgi:hypothetical protein